MHCHIFDLHNYIDFHTQPCQLKARLWTRVTVTSSLSQGHPCFTTTLILNTDQNLWVMLSIYRQKQSLIKKILNKSHTWSVKSQKKKIIFRCFPKILCSCGLRSVTEMTSWVCNLKKWNKNTSLVNVRHVDIWLLVLIM